MSGEATAGLCRYERAAGTLSYPFHREQRTGLAPQVVQPQKLKLAIWGTRRVNVRPTRSLPREASWTAAVICRFRTYRAIGKRQMTTAVQDASRGNERVGRMFTTRRGFSGVALVRPRWRGGERRRGGGGLTQCKCCPRKKLRNQQTVLTTAVISESFESDLAHTPSLMQFPVSEGRYSTYPPGRERHYNNNGFRHPRLGCRFSCRPASGFCQICPRGPIAPRRP